MSWGKFDEDPAAQRKHLRNDPATQEARRHLLALQKECAERAKAQRAEDRLKRTERQRRAAGSSDDG